MNTTDTEIRSRIRSYITENFLYMRPDFALGDDDPLLERGIVDSMGVMEVLQFIEEEFGVQAADDEITEENLNSLDAITRFVSGKRSHSYAA
ncbi:MAG TPA: acyl carrier protein [Gemmatimonadaceae bacterium]|nr:acyl carrier protein [Gemmatimonadaceae bacterium]